MTHSSGSVILSDQGLRYRAKILILKPAQGIAMTRSSDSVILP